MGYGRGASPNSKTELVLLSNGIEHRTETGLRFYPYSSIHSVDVDATTEVTLDPAVGYVTTMNLNINMVETGGTYNIGTSGTYTEVKELYHRIKNKLS